MLTAAQLMERITRASAGFESLGVGFEDTVALLLRNDFPFFEASLAANFLGAHAVPINWHFQADECRYILEDSRAKVLVVHADLLPQIAPAIASDLHVLVVPTPEEIQAAYAIPEAACAPPAGSVIWDQWVDEQAPRAPGPLPSPSSMIYTSGTTGNPKGVRREPYTPESTARFAEMVETMFGLKAGTDVRTAITGPMYHSAPNAYGLWAAKTGSFCVLQPRFDPEDLLRLIERYRITHLHMVPTMFVRLLKLPDDVRHRYDLTSLRFVVHAAAPCSADIKRQMIEWWGPVINEYYGATEVGCVTYHTSEEALRKPGTVGRGAPGSIVRVYDDEGKVLGPGQIGEIYVRVSGFPDFTYNGLPERRAEVERDSLITVGDIGYLDEEGYLFICDRKRDMVISGGVNIYPAEIETALIEAPGVHDVAVFGIPDEEFGETLCAYIEPETGKEVTAGTIREFLSSRIAHFKIPRVIEFMSPLPREDSGKIFKRKLRDPYWQKAGRQI
ncbi:MAG TPA: acyl-CoA synthetase [Blastocatellia bacterium]|nr:acyl-CoA synthetase [Blastocatellia bacterium]